MSSRRIFAGLGVALVAALAPAAAAQADPVVLPPPTADVGQPTLIRLEGFPANSTVQVQVAPHEDVAAREITVSHVPVDGRGSGAIQFTWPTTYQHCEQNGIHVTCKRRAWATPEIADVSAGAVNDPGEANIASLRLQAAGTPAPDLRLAQRFRPLLQFDTSERWRPLEIQRLFADSSPLVCLQKGRGCVTASSPTTIDVPTVPPGQIPRQPEFLDWPGSQSVPSSYFSPHPECRRNGLLDCDSGPRSAIYAHQVRGPGGGYTYLDYWWFYRFNHAPFQQIVYDEHEGDWEGAEVAVSGADPQQFDFVGFAAHTAVWRYLHAVLTCDNPVTHQDSGCNSFAKRPRVYVANGTHASYPVPCRKLAKFIFVIHYCWQTGKPLPEQGFDGKRPWGDNFDLNALQAFGVPWVDYPLNWNSAPKPTVNSPANQGRYQHPWETSCTLVPAVVPLGCLSAAQRGECESWNGPFTAATACDPAELDQALRSGTLGRPGSFSLSLDGSRTGSAPGLAQAVGGALAAGQTVRLSGRAPATTQLLLQAQDRSSVLSVRYSSLHLSAGGTVTVRAVRARGHVALVATSPTGARLRPAQTVRQSLRPPRRPRRVHARRHGRRVRVTFRARSANASVQLRRTRRGAALTTRLVHLRHGSRQRVTLPTIRRARFVTVSAINRNGISSRPVTVRIR